MREIDFDTWSEFKEYASKSFSDGLGVIFRGQRDSS